MISASLEAEILRLYHAEKWPIGTIAAQLRVHHTTVRRVLAQAQIPAGRQSLRPSIADPYVGFIVQILEKYPRLRASRLYEMVCARGYPGRPDHFRAVVARYRPRPAPEAYLRLRTLPGEQAQVLEHSRSVDLCDRSAISYRPIWPSGFLTAVPLGVFEATRF